MTNKQLRFLCFGMGAIGTYIGGSLAAAGQQVSFLERPEAKKDLRTRILTIDTPLGEKIVRDVSIFFSLKEALMTSRFDVVLLAVKSFDTQNVIEMIRPHADGFPIVLCLQNGVENEPQLEGVLGRERVIGASIATAVGKRGTGDVFVQKMRGLGIESTHPLSEQLLDVFNKANLNARGYPNRGDLKWSKMVTNLLGNATSAILNWTPAQIFSDRWAYEIEIRQINETLMVMKANGLKLVNLPGTPIMPLIQLMEHLPRVLSRPFSYLAMGKGRGDKMPSFHIDLYNGQKRSEVTYLNGAVVRVAAELNIPTPTNRGLTSILEDLAAGKRTKTEFANQPQKLLAAIEAL